MLVCGKLFVNNIHYLLFIIHFKLLWQKIKLQSRNEILVVIGLFWQWNINIFTMFTGLWKRSSTTEILCVIIYYENLSTTLYWIANEKSS